MAYKTATVRRLLPLLTALLFLLSVAPLAAQQVDDPGEIQILTSNETEKDSGVWVDDEYIGYLRDFWGNKKIMLSPGEHEIGIRKFGYKDFKQKVQIDPGQVYLLPIHMELDVNTQYPTENTVSLRINATPQDAAVLIDGAYVGYVRQIGRSLTVTAGRRKVRIEMQGYRPYENEFQLTAGRPPRSAPCSPKAGRNSTARRASPTHLSATAPPGSNFAPDASISMAWPSAAQAAPRSSASASMRR